MPEASHSTDEMAFVALSFWFVYLLSLHTEVGDKFF